MAGLGRQIVQDATHEALVGRELHAMEIVDAIGEVIESARAGEPLPRVSVMIRTTDAINRCRGRRC